MSLPYLIVLEYDILRDDNVIVPYLEPNNILQLIHYYYFKNENNDVGLMLIIR
jgi:hypothetical protein